MKIAILMSTYNGQKYLEEQMKSLQKQTLKDITTIYIRDDGSNDDTIKIIERWSEYLDIVLYKEENIGPAQSFWKLFMNMDIQADYYAFCDQDDIWDYDKLEKGVEALRNEKKEALWCSNCRIINNNNKIILDKMNMKVPDFSIVSQMVCGTTQGCSMMLNNILRNYIAQKNIKKFPMHDFVVMTYAIAKGNVIYDSNPSFSYRVHDANVIASGGKNTLTHIKDSLKRWFSNSHRNELSEFAKVFMKDNKDCLDMETSSYITNLIKSKHNLICRVRIVFNRNTKSDNKRAERSFKIRTILGVV